jgi:ABC-type glutathione transport system ATPase component
VGSGRSAGVEVWQGCWAVLVFLVTGVSGAGKSTLARRMAAWAPHDQRGRGQLAVFVDGPGWVPRRAAGRAGRGLAVGA